MFWFGIQVNSPYHPLISSLDKQPFQTYTGSECLYQMLKAIWPSIAHVPNHLPISSHISTVGSYPSSHHSLSELMAYLVGIMCYFLYWLIQLPLLLVSPQRIRHFFTVKSIVVPTAWLAILIWAMVRVPTKTSLAPHKSTLTGSATSWAWLSALNSSLGFYATLAVNIPDFTVRKTTRFSSLT